MDVQACHLGIAHLESLRIVVGIELAGDAQASGRGGSGDQLDDGEAGGERFAAPVLGDVTEEAVLDLVPFRGSGRVVAKGDDEPGLVGELLEFDFPEPQAGAVGAAAIGRESLTCRRDVLRE